MIFSLHSCSSFSCGNCAVKVQYGDGSQASGYVYRDDYFPETSSAPVPIYLGAMSSVTGRFSSLLDDGILGLAFSPLAYGIPTFMHSLKEAGYADSFSACYGKYDDGVMVFGGYDPSLVAPNSFEYKIPVSKEAGYFSVSPTNFGFGSDGMSIYSTAILDTGTTLLMVPSYMLITIQNWFAKVAGGYTDVMRIVNNPGRYICLSKPQLQAFLPCLPNFTISFKDVVGKVCV